MTDQLNGEKDDDLDRGFHGIPDDGKIQDMSYVQLCEVRNSCEKDSPKFYVMEREVKRRLAIDQAEINRPNMLLAAAIGGTFALVGIVVGAYLRNEPSAQQGSLAAVIPQTGSQQVASAPQSACSSIDKAVDMPKAD